MRKLSDEGKAMERSRAGLVSGWLFLPRLNVLDVKDGKAGTSESVDGLGGSSPPSWKDFFLDRNRFIVADNGRVFRFIVTTLIVDAQVR